MQPKIHYGFFRYFTALRMFLKIKCKVELKWSVMSAKNPVPRDTCNSSLYGTTVKCFNNYENCNLTDLNFPY